MKEAGFENPEQAHAYIIEKLEERYGTGFVYVGNPRTTMLPNGEGIHMYRADFALASDPDKVFIADVTIYGGVGDNYSQYFFKDEVIRRCTGPLAPFSFIEDCTAELRPRFSGRVWKEDDAVEDYMGDGSLMTHPDVVVKIHLSDTYTSEEQAEQVKQCMDALYDVGFKLYVQFYTEIYADEPFSHAIYSRMFGASPDPEFRFDADFYLEEIERNKYWEDLRCGRIAEEDAGNEG